MPKCIRDKLADVNITQANLWIFAILPFIMTVGWGVYKWEQNEPVNMFAMGCIFMFTACICWLVSAIWNTIATSKAWQEFIKLVTMVVIILFCGQLTANNRYAPAELMPTAGRNVDEILHNLRMQPFCIIAYLSHMIQCSMKIAGAMQVAHLVCVSYNFSLETNKANTYLAALLMLTISCMVTLGQLFPCMIFLVILYVVVCIWRCNGNIDEFDDFTFYVNEPVRMATNVFATVRNFTLVAVVIFASFWMITDVYTKHDYSLIHNIYDQVTPVVNNLVMVYDFAYTGFDTAFAFIENSTAFTTTARIEGNETYIVAELIAAAENVTELIANTTCTKVTTVFTNANTPAN